LRRSFDFILIAPPGSCTIALSGVTAPPRKILMPYDSFAADDADLDGPATLRGVDHRHHGLFRKVHRLDFLIRAINDLAAPQRHVLELGQEALVFGGEERREDACSSPKRRVALLTARPSRAARAAPRSRARPRAACRRSPAIASSGSRGGS
jgi:hypothetical protein